MGLVIGSNATIIVLALGIAAVLAFTPRIRSSHAWKATVTPLASIMGSGFLVSAPLVAAEVGVYAPLAMAGLLVVAYGIGAMVRFNIRYAERQHDGSATPGVDTKHRAHRGHQLGTHEHWRSAERHLGEWLERISHVVLAGAYVVSVTYYLQLMSAFVLERFGMSGLTLSRVMATSVLALITAVGAVWGLQALERVETYAISLNLGMIGALIGALIVHDGSLALHGNLALPHLVPDADTPHATRIIMGLLVIVQGFETSRFLGAEHSADERIRTMRAAQIIASVIYLAFVTLTLPLFSGGELAANVTAIVRLVAPVAVVLPTLIVITAVGSQFSASVADDAGCGGLLQTFFGDHLAPRWAYVIIGGAAIAITWLTDVLSIISLASRAFALFYALQCGVAAVTALRRENAKHRAIIVVMATALALVSLAITIFGAPAE